MNLRTIINIEAISLLIAYLGQIKMEIGNWRQLYLFRRPILLILILFIFVIGLSKKLGFLQSPPDLDASRHIGESVILTGLIYSHPDSRPKAVMFDIKIETLQLLKNRQSLSSANGRLLVQVFGVDDTFGSPGDRVRLVGKILKPASSKIPGTFDYENYLKTKNIYSILYTSQKNVSNLGPSGQRPWFRLGWRLRERMMTVFKTRLKSEEAAVLGGLVLGVRPRHHPDIKNIFIKSGTMHILVASGSNVAFLVGFIFLTARFIFFLPKRAALLISIPLIWLYVFIIGADPPIFRAGVMMTVGIMGTLLMREDKFINSLGIAAFTILIINPKSLFDVGFLMSFGTVLGMILTLPKLEPPLKSAPRFVRWVCRVASATLVAQLWLYPITANVFKRIFPIGLVSNIFILPLSGIGLGGGFFLAGLDLISKWISFGEPLVKAAAVLIGAYVKSIIWLVNFFATHPGTEIWLSPKPPLWIASFYVLCLTALYLHKSKTAQVVFLTASLLMALSSGKPPLTLDSKLSRVVWLDCGRSISTFIQTPTGETILINPGPSEPTDCAERVLLPFFAHHSIRRLDAILLTQHEKRKTASWTYLTQALKVNNVIFFTQQNLPVDHVHPHLLPGEKWTQGPLTIEGLPGSKSAKGSTPLLVSFADRQFLISDFFSFKTQESLLQRPNKKFNFIQGRFTPRTKWKDAFLNTITPQTIIETGYKNNESNIPWKNAAVHWPQENEFIELNF